MDITEILTRNYPNAEWAVENNQIVEWMSDHIKQPTMKELEKAWPDVQAAIERQQIEQVRKARYEAETDHLLYEALARLELSELKEWQDKRKQIKDELPYGEEKNDETK